MRNAHAGVGGHNREMTVSQSAVAAALCRRTPYTPRALWSAGAERSGDLIIPHIVIAVRNGGELGGGAGLARAVANRSLN